MALPRTEEDIDAEMAAIDVEIEALRSERIALEELRENQTHEQKEG